MAESHSRRDSEERARPAEVATSAAASPCVIKRRNGVFGLPSLSLKVAARLLGSLPSPPHPAHTTMAAFGDAIAGVSHLNKTDGSLTPRSEYSEELEKPGASTFSQDSVFDDPTLAKFVALLDSGISHKLTAFHRFYAPPENYESRHRFDPTARWTEEEEAAVRRKCDWRICFFVCICFAALQLDRGNVSLENLACDRY